MRDPSFDEDFRFGNKYLPVILPILRTILCPMDFVMDINEDMERNADLLYVSAVSQNTAGRPLRIGIRGRRFRYYEQYPFDFTHKIKTFTGYEAEFQKIHDHGFGDLFFYFFENKEGNGICSWFLADLNKEREYVDGIRRQYLPGMTDFEYFDYVGKVRPVTKKDQYENIIDQYYFVALNRNDMPEGFVLASSDDPEWEQAQAWVKCL